MRSWGTGNVCRRDEPKLFLRSKSFRSFRNPAGHIVNWVHQLSPDRADDNRPKRAVILAVRVVVTPLWAALGRPWRGLRPTGARGMAPDRATSVGAILGAVLAASAQAAPAPSQVRRCPPRLVTGEQSFGSVGGRPDPRLRLAWRGGILRRSGRSQRRAGGCGLSAFQPGSTRAMGDTRGEAE